MSIERPDWNAPAVVSAPDPDAVIAEMAEGKGPSPATQSLVKSETTPMLYDQNHAPVPAKGRGFSGLPDWDGKERPRDEQGRFLSPTSDAGLVASLGLTAEVAGVLAAQPEGMGAAVDTLRNSMTRVWGSEAAQVAEWAAELSPSIQAKAAKVLMACPHLSGKEVAKRIQQTLTLNEAAEVSTWLAKV
jgi:hypothetical protein